MNKMLCAVSAAALAVSLFAGAAYAKQPANTKTQDLGTRVEEKVADQDVQPVTVKAKKNDSQSVTEDTYGNGGHKGYKGLLNALENVKDKPAGAVITDLLVNKYGYDASELEGIGSELSTETKADEALSTLADWLEQKGTVTDAVYVQQEAVKADVKNVNSYKKLGKLYEKVGKTGVKAFVNGEEPEFDVQPVIKDGSTLVPFRAVAEALKADVQWNEDERSVTVTKDGISVKLILDSTTALVNGQEVQLEVPGQLLEGRTVVPFRFIGEALKATVEWEPETQTAIIYDN